MIDSNAKGARAERQSARALTKWMTGHYEDEAREDPPSLWRSTQSGGWSWRDIGDVGDLAPVDEYGAEFRRHFAVEVKHREAVPFWQLYTQESPTILEWWDKIRAEAYEYCVCPLILIRQNHYPRIVGMPYSFFLHSYGGRHSPGLPYPVHLTIGEQGQDPRRERKDRGMAIVSQDEFMKFDPPEQYKRVRSWREKYLGCEAPEPGGGG